MGLKTNCILGAAHLQHFKKDCFAVEISDISPALEI